jgi:hypothetical protein
MYPRQTYTLDVESSESIDRVKKDDWALIFQQVVVLPQAAVSNRPRKAYERALPETWHLNG